MDQEFVLVSIDENDPKILELNEWGKKGYKFGFHENRKHDQNLKTKKDGCKQSHEEW